MNVSEILEVFSKNFKSALFWKFFGSFEIYSQLVKQKFPPDEQIMITRKSFFIRWLLIGNDEKPQEKQSVIDIEHIQSGSGHRVSSLEEASEWMREIDAESEKKEKFTKERR